jgi:hypothetical protein
MDLADVELRRMRKSARAGPQKMSHVRYLDLGPDVEGKSYTSGSGPYTVEVPNGVMDAPFLSERYSTTLVGYLRLCLRWGGFPGLQQMDSAPTELAFITQELLSM